MATVTSVDAQNRFGELIDRAQREPVEVTHRGRTIAYVVSELDMRELRSLHRRREEAAQWYSEYRQKFVENRPNTPASTLTDDDVNALVHALR